MSKARQKRLVNYLAHIKRYEGGLEAVRETTPETMTVRTESVLESMTEMPQKDAAVEKANSALRKLKANPELELRPSELASIEAIIIPDERPAFDVQDGDFRADHPNWRKLDTDGDLHARLTRAIPAIGRIDLPGQTRIPFGGTGFLVGPGLLMTNRHVAEIFATGLGDRSLRFITGRQAAIDFRHERDRDNAEAFKVQRIVMIHPYWDMALLAVDGAAANRASLKLSPTAIEELNGREIAVIGYPAYDPIRNDIGVQNKLYNSTYGVKRLQPGMLGERLEIESFKKLVSAGTHDASTLGGCSGAALVDLQTGDIVGLHFGGRYLDINYAVPASELARDGRVVDAGVSFAGSPSGGTPPWSDYWKATEMPGATNAKTGDTMTSSGGGNSNAQGNNVSVPPSGGSVSLTIPLHITVSLGAPVMAQGVSMAPGRETVEAATDLTEKMVEPAHDDETVARNGYDAHFLGAGTEVPMPKAADPGVLAPLKNGGTKLDYQNFSLEMHAARRIALFTACNVTTEAKLKTPEAGKDYSRRGLSGLGPSDMEKWIAEPRLDDKYQLPDAFFTKDQGAFDKGHIVRREDVAWGETYATVRRANGDTYHVTNCSPQVAQFNQSAKGEDNWGDLENLVFSNAASERLCVFAGPILDDSDEVFIGTAGGGVKLRVKIPRAYWKVIVSKVSDGIAAYGFILDQDLSAVPLEFTVSENFRRLMVSLEEIERRAGIRFPDTVRDADQINDERGLELAFRGGIEGIMEETDAPERETPTPNSGDDEAAGLDGSQPAAGTMEMVTEAPIDWRVAKALVTLRNQVNAKAPNRKKGWDGTIGDAAHASRSSDHNPWVLDGRQGVVTAFDITHDPANGCDANALAEAIRGSRDRRVKYIIWNRHIASSSPVNNTPAWAWRNYTGKNPHDHHVHISVNSQKELYDSTESWRI